MDLSKLDYLNPPSKIDLEKISYNDEWTMPWIQKRFSGLGPDACFALYCNAQGIQPKQFRSMLKKLRKKEKSLAK